MGRVTLHRLICRLGSHVWFERFRYAPQGFASTYYVTTLRCFVCGVERNGRAPYPRP
jgi:hypothetical protein